MTGIIRLYPVAVKGNFLFESDVVCLLTTKTAPFVLTSVDLRQAVTAPCELLIKEVKKEIFLSGTIPNPEIVSCRALTFLLSAHSKVRRKGGVQQTLF